MNSEHFIKAQWKLRRNMRDFSPYQECNACISSPINLLTQRVKKSIIYVYLSALESFKGREQTLKTKEKLLTKADGIFQDF